MVIAIRYFWHVICEGSSDEFLMKIIINPYTKPGALKHE